MDNLRHIQQQTTEDEFEVEITDLDQTDAATRTWVLAEGFLNWQRSIERRRWQLLSTAGISLLLIVFLTFSGLFSLMANILHLSLTSNTGPHAFVPYASTQRPSEQNSISCLVDAAWSPGSKEIAVVGYRLKCPQSGVSEPGLVNLYNISTGKLLKQLQPDNLILHALDLWLYSFLSSKRPNGWRANDSSLLKYSYSHLLWSSDGKRLALTFSTTTLTPTLNGVLLMDLSGAHPRVLLQQQNPSNPFYAEWDVKNGVAVTLPPAPPAVAYHWGTDGSLIPIIPLTNNKVPLGLPPGPVGNPVGSPTFTIWQSGFANSIVLENDATINIWSTNFAAWSPDGRYLVDGIGLNGLLSQPGLVPPIPQSSDTYHLKQEPLLPAHDPALLQVATFFSAVAWRPDGRVLAAYDSQDIVVLYDCNTGRRIRGMHPISNNSLADGSNVLLRWSPDGSQLLLSSVQWGLVTVWGQIRRFLNSPS